MVAVSDRQEGEPTADTARALQATSLILLSVVGSGANILVAIVFYRRPALRSPSNRSVSHLQVVGSTACTISIKMSYGPPIILLFAFKYFFYFVDCNSKLSRAQVL